MSNEFEDRIKAIEAELLNLKTASEYTSVRSANYTTGTTATTGLYQIVYANNNDQVFSIVSKTGGTGNVRPRTPTNGTQDVEVNTDLYDPNTGTITREKINLAVASNYPVISITKIQ